MEEKLIEINIPALPKEAKIGLAAAAGLVFLLAPGKTTRRERAPFMGMNFAHRGLHSEDKSVPENSLAAFALAAEAGYGIELDVQLTKDGKVVVFHDDTLDRVCGVSGRVDDYTFDELQAFPLCGTEQRIPLFKTVLDLVDARSPLIVELKTGKRNAELCRKTYDLLCSYRGAACIESFNPLIVRWFKRHGKDIVRGQLAMPAERYDGFPAPARFILSRCLLNCLARPQFIAYKIGRRPAPVHLSEAMGAIKVAWTSHDVKNEKGKDAVIFEFYKPERQYKKC